MTHVVHERPLPSSPTQIPTNGARSTQRVHPLEGREAPLLLGVLNRVSRHLLGQEAVPLKILAHNPCFLLPYLALSRLVQGKTRLSPAIRILVMHHVAQINGCAWCLDFGQFQASRLRVPPEKLGAAGDPTATALFSPAEQAALAYATEVTAVGARVADGTFATLRQHYSEREIVELTVAIAAENMFNRLNAPLEIESQGFCALPAHR